jgi:hypothetical protein
VKTSVPIAYRIAGGRRRHLCCLQANRDARRALVARHYAEAVAAGGPAWGTWTRLAASLNVSKATLSRDLAAIRGHALAASAAAG